MDDTLNKPLSKSTTSAGPSSFATLYADLTAVLHHFALNLASPEHEMDKIPNPDEHGGHDVLLAALWFLLHDFSQKVPRGRP
jgi:hypothetical protein